MKITPLVLFRLSLVTRLLSHKLHVFFVFCLLSPLSAQTLDVGPSFAAATTAATTAAASNVSCESAVATMTLLRPSVWRTGIVRDAGWSCLRCSKCVASLSRPAASHRRFWRLSVADKQPATWTLDRAYFSASRMYGANRCGVSPLANVVVPGDKSSADGTTAAPSQAAQELPHRRRKRLKEEEKEEKEKAGATKVGVAAPEPVIAPDASAQLSKYSSTLPESSLRRKLAAFLALTKPRLSFLIVLTTTSAYGLYPISSLLTLDPAMTPVPTLSTSTLTLLYLSSGTFLSSCSANTLNMLLEPKYDAQMSRTRNRPLVRGLVSHRATVIFAAATAVSGLFLLYVGTNPTVTALSAANIVLYAFVYTPLKRLHVINTWVGAVVGGIPPLMGWVAAAGQTATTGHDTWRDMLLSKDSIGGWLLAGILFAWQFPHFNALSHTIRDEYRAAGYKMLCWTNPARNARVALRYAVLMFPLSVGLWWVGVVDSGFLVSSSVANGWLLKEAYRFWKYQGGKGTARGLFWASVWQLPILLVGGLVSKKGLWDGVWQSLFLHDDGLDDAAFDDEDNDDDYIGYMDDDE